MKHALFFLLLCFIGQNSFGQIVAGDTVPGFYHATYLPIYRIQDTVYDNTQTATQHIIPVDLDGDQVIDLSIYSRYFASFNGSFWYPVWWCGLELDSLTDAMIVDSSFNTMDTLPFGSGISSTGNWLSGNVRFCSNINNYTVDSTWKDKSVYYAGLRVRRTNDTLYGWLKVSVQDYHIVFLEEHACQSLYPRDTVISLQTSLEENIGHSPDEFRVFPNPASSFTTLQTNHQLKNATLRMENSSGQTVWEQQSQSGNMITIDCHHMVSGVYFLSIMDDHVTTVIKVMITDE